MHCEINNKNPNPDTAVNCTTAENMDPLNKSKKITASVQRRSLRQKERRTYVHARYAMRECNTPCKTRKNTTNPLANTELLMRHGASAGAGRGRGGCGPGRPPGGSRRRPREPPAGRAAAPPPAVPPAVGVETGWQPPTPPPEPAPRSPCPASRRDRRAPPRLPRGPPDKRCR